MLTRPNIVVADPVLAANLANVTSSGQLLIVVDEDVVELLTEIRDLLRMLCEEVGS